METGEAVLWIIRIGVTAVLFGLLLTQIVMITGHDERPRHVELALYQERLVYGPMGIAEGGELVPSRMTAAHLNKVYQQDEPLFGARFRVYATRSDFDAGTVALEAIHEPDIVTHYLALAAAGMSGPGGGLYERHVLPVILRDANGVSVQLLEIEAVMRT